MHVVWEFEAKLRPARAKRPESDQLRWKMGGILENRGRQAAYAKTQCATDPGEAGKDFGRGLGPRVHH